MPSAAVLAAMTPDRVLDGAVSFSVTGGRVVERLRNGEMVPWAGYIVVEETDTGDNRRVAQDALYWENLPLPLMAQFVNPIGGSGHDGAVLAGNITTMERHGPRIWATGYIDPFAPGGLELALALDRQTMRGISVDLDSVQLAQTRGGQRNIGRGRIRGATACPFHALIDAEIAIHFDEEFPMAASAATATATLHFPIDDVESLVASGGSSIPLAPPKSWFQKPQNPADMNHPLHISADGRLSGIIASEGTCHIAFSGRCVPPPKSQTNYAAFRTGSVVTAEGDEVRTGPIVMDTVHPDLRRQASDAMAFYADTGCAVADVVPYDTQYGIFVAGVVRPTATPEQIRNLRASDISPDWRYINGNPRECCALVAVNNGGFKVRQALAAAAGEYVMPGRTAVALTEDDDIFALVASGGVVQSGIEQFGPANKRSSHKEIVGSHGHAPHGTSILWPAMYEHLKRQGHSKASAARISNAAWNDKHGRLAADTDTTDELGSDGDCGCGCNGAPGGCGTKVGKTKNQEAHQANLEKFTARFGPRVFHAPKTRMFRVAQFHLQGQHNQQSHAGGRGGGSDGPSKQERDAAFDEVMRWEGPSDSTAKRKVRARYDEIVDQEYGPKQYAPPTLQHAAKQALIDEGYGDLTDDDVYVPGPPDPDTPYQRALRSGNKFKPRRRST